MIAQFALFVLALQTPAQMTVPPGTKLPPYTFILSVGEQRGRSHCYVCESIEKPVVILFAPARDPNKESKSDEGWTSVEVTQIAKFMDGELAKRGTLASWLTFCSPKQEDLDGPIVRWADKAALRRLPVGTFEDAQGPPAYRLDGKELIYAVIAKDGKIEKVLSLKQGEEAKGLESALTIELDRIAPVPPKEKSPPKETKTGSTPESKPVAKPESAGSPKKPS
jgi:hypothetical protein